MIDYKIPYATEEGYIKPMSFNPYDGGTFEAIGPSHSKGGIPIDSTGSGVANAEIEGGETIHNSLGLDQVIGGNLTIPGTKTKFKKAFKAIASHEKSADKLGNKGSTLLENSNPENKYGVLGYNAGNVLTWSADRQQKALALEKENLTQVQQAIHNVAEATGIKPENVNNEFKNGGMLGKKKVVVTGVPEFKNGGTLPIMKGGGKTTMAERNNNPGNMRDNKGNFIHFNSYEEGLQALQNKLNNAVGAKSKVYSAKGNLYDFYNHYAPKSDNNDPKAYAEIVARKIGVDPNTPISQLGNKIPLWAQATAEQEDIAYSKKRNTALPNLPVNTSGQTTKSNNIPIKPEIEQYSPMAPIQPVGLNNPSIGALNPVSMQPELDQMRQQYAPPEQGQQRTPSLADNNKLGVGQLLPEIATLFDKPEPVLHQRLDPQLYQPYNVSFQDQLNQNNTSFKAVQEQIGNNPEAASVVFGQKLSADNQVLGNQFRTNQGIQSDIINKNIGIINQSRETNLALQDKQFVRQEQAKQNTKDNIRGAINSISNKFAQNKLENNNIRLTETMTSYRFNPATGKMDFIGQGNPLNAYGNSGTQNYDPNTEYDTKIVINPDGTQTETKIAKRKPQTMRRYYAGGKMK